MKKLLALITVAAIGGILFFQYSAPDNYEGPPLIGPGLEAVMCKTGDGSLVQGYKAEDGTIVHIVSEGSTHTHVPCEH